jgi:hypothetical protein
MLLTEVPNTCGINIVQANVHGSVHFFSPTAPEYSVRRIVTSGTRQHTRTSSKQYFSGKQGCSHTQTSLTSHVKGVSFNMKSYTKDITAPTAALRHPAVTEVTRGASQSASPYSLK